MTEVQSTQHAAELRIAAAQAHRTPVDSQGRPTEPHRVFTYDDRGLLAAVTPTPEGVES